MSKAHSFEDFCEKLTSDRTWRIREISDLRALAERAEDFQRSAVLRALVTISYAHWEGHTKFAAKQYLEFVSRRKLLYRLLDEQFRRNSFLALLAAKAVAGMSLSERSCLVGEIIGSDEKRFTRFDDELVSTRSNLSFEVLTDICLVCGIDVRTFIDDRTFIDTLLVKRRNEIAHGQDVFLGLSDVSNLTDRSISLMRKFGNEVENKVASGLYLRSKAQATDPLS